jgi:hypothetical protein
MSHFQARRLAAPHINHPAHARWPADRLHPPIPGATRFPLVPGASHSIPALASDLFPLPPASSGSLGGYI